jgi:predicted enzyme related to lactoylglutathione lyase
MADNPHGKFVWNELMTHDVEKAKAFYSAVVGWKYETMPGPGGSTYWIVKNGDERVGGMFPMVQPELRDVPDQWVSYIAVDDVDARVKKATAAGAKVMHEAFDIPNVGRIAALRDARDAMICLIKPNPNM